MTASAKPRFLLLWLLLAAGAGLNLVLALHQAGAAPGSSQGLPGCSLAGFRCDEVLASPYGRVLGVSLSWWGLAFYGCLAVVLLTARRLDELPARLLAAVATVPGAAAAAWLVVVMKTQIGAFCLWCLAIHGVNLLLFLTAVYQAQTAWDRAQGAASAPAANPPSRRLLVTSFATGVLLAGWQIAFLALLHAPAALTLAAVPGHDADPLAELSLASGADGIATVLDNTVLGNPASPHKIVVFTCLTCRHCRKVHAMLERIQQQAGDRYRIELRFAPLSPDCNPAHSAADSAPAAAEHREACPLARLAIAVALADPPQFAPYVDWLYARQGALSLADARAEAQRRAGASVLTQGQTEMAVDHRLARDVRLAREFEVASVPQIFLPRGQLAGPIDERGLERLLDEVFGD